MNTKKLRICIEICEPHLMSEKQLRSLGKQLKFIYSENKKHISPATLIIQNYEYIKDFMEKTHNAWNFERNTLEIQSAIYLSGDAEKELDTIDENRTYVIGGLVDRNSHKNYIYNYCRANNFECYKLPIKAYVELNCSTILSTNQVFKILLDYNVTQDWKYSLDENIPRRKRAKNQNRTFDNFL